MINLVIAQTELGKQLQSLFLSITHQSSLLLSMIIEIKKMEDTVYHNSVKFSRKCRAVCRAVGKDRIKTDYYVCGKDAFRQPDCCREIVVGSIECDDISIVVVTQVLPVDTEHILIRRKEVIN